MGRGYFPWIILCQNVELSAIWNGDLTCHFRPSCFTPASRRPMSPFNRLFGQKMFLYSSWTSFTPLHVRTLFLVFHKYYIQANKIKKKRYNYAMKHTIRSQLLVKTYYLAFHTIFGSNVFTQIYLKMHLFSHQSCLRTLKLCKSFPQIIPCMKIMVI